MVLPMTIRIIPTLMACFVVFAAGAATATLGRARAEPQPAFDRVLVERLVHAQEAQAHALEALTRAIEHCKR
jgi:hypothetical protein